MKSKRCQVPNELFGARDVVGGRAHGRVARPDGVLEAWNEDNGLVLDNAQGECEVSLSRAEEDLHKPLVTSVYTPSIFPR